MLLANLTGRETKEESCVGRCYSLYCRADPADGVVLLEEISRNLQTIVHDIVPITASYE
jgi:hypothetical protein